MPIEDLFQRGEQLARDAEKEITDLEKQRVAIDEQIKRARALIRLIRPDRSKKKAATAYKTTIAAETLLRVAKACMVLAQDPSREGGMFAVADVSQSLGLHDSTVRFAFGELREREFLRKLPGRHNRREQYTVLDEHVLDMLTAAASENGNGAA